MSEKVTTTVEERDAIAEKAVALFNTCFTDFAVGTDTNGKIVEETNIIKGGGRELTSDDIKITQVTKRSKAGHLTQHESGEYWKLGVAIPLWRDTWSVNRKTAFLLHELSHLPVTTYTHDKTFWRVFADSINTANENESVIEKIMEGDVWMDVIRNYAAKGVSGADGVTDIAAQRTTFCDAIDYDDRFLGSFERTPFTFSEDAEADADKVVPLSSIAVRTDTRDWHLHQLLDRYAPTNYRSGELLRFTEPLHVTETPSNNNTYDAEIAGRSKRRATLLKRIQVTDLQEIDYDVPITVTTPTE